MYYSLDGLQIIYQLNDCRTSWLCLCFGTYEKKLLETLILCVCVCISFWVNIIHLGKYKETHMVSYGKNMLFLAL